MILYKAAKYAAIIAVAATYVSAAAVSTSVTDVCGCKGGDNI